MRLITINTILFAALLMFSCNNQDDDVTPPINIETDADAYVFARDGQSSVSTSAQMEMGDMLSSLIEYSQLGNDGQIVETRIFRNIFENKGDNGGGRFDFETSTQLEENLIQVDLDDDYFGDFFEQASIASKSGDRAASFTPGIVTRESTGNDILVNNLGQSFSQCIEKGIMGSIFQHQMLNVFLTDAYTGNDVDNVNLVLGQNYTQLEYNWDKAFGYFMAPGDFGSSWPAARNGELRYWSYYSNLVDPLLGSNDKIMNAFRSGRLAIVDNDLDVVKINRDILYEELELLAAASAIHYINMSISHLEAQRQGDLLHTLSAAYMFVRSLNVNPRKKIIFTQLHNILNVDFGTGGNFWMATLEGLENAKATLVEVYGLEEVGDAL